MICYLPFPSVTQPFDILSQSLGPVTVYGPVNTFVTDQMRVWQQQGLLDFRTPSAFNDVQFAGTLQAYKDWAQLHDGQIGDMIQFFHASNGRPPLIDESSPSQIRTQIQHQGKDDRKVADPVLQAALFLALAQEYDQHQERLHREMGTVADMERAMYATLGSDDSGSESLGEQTGGATEGPFSHDPGAHMTDRRIQAWAQLAAHDSRPSHAYVTSSPAVFEYLKARVSEPIELGTWYLSSQADDKGLKRPRLEAIQDLCRSKILDSQLLNPELSGPCSVDAMPLVLIGWSGSMFEVLLPKRFSKSMQPQGNSPAAQDLCNTVIGLVG